ncbi:MAG: enoyl-CoA hydratase [Alphaproteobacteria bacterium]|nr:enoyl-CoA hydratase [Alphaproteobacteria bacterium]
MTYKMILTETQGRVSLIRLNRPDAANALNRELIRELNHALDRFEDDEDSGCLIITGSENVFSAGAEIREMKDKNFTDMLYENYIEEWEQLTRVRKPVIAAVAGHALGGGCELAMMCDFIIAAENAIFAQPELGLGVMPGAGGTQRLTRIIGKAKAMDMCLTGRSLLAQEAEQSGLVSRVVPCATLMTEALSIAQKIASMPTTATLMIKDAVNSAYETTLSEGISFERRSFYALFSTSDQKEGMNAFLEKRPARFRKRPQTDL